MANSFWDKLKEITAEVAVSDGVKQYAQRLNALGDSLRSGIDSIENGSPTQRISSFGNLAGGLISSVANIGSKLVGATRDNEYDAQFTPEYFDSDPEKYGRLIDLDYKTASMEDLISSADTLWKIQAGENYRNPSKWADDSEASAYGRNSAYNRNSSDDAESILWQFKNRATEEEYRAGLDVLRSNYAAAGPGDYSDRLKRAIEDLEEYGRENFSGLMQDEQDKLLQGIRVTHQRIDRLNNDPASYESLNDPSFYMTPEVQDRIAFLNGGSYDFSTLTPEAQEEYDKYEKNLHTYAPEVQQQISDLHARIDDLNEQHAAGEKKLEEQKAWERYAQLIESYNGNIDWRDDFSLLGMAVDVPKFSGYSEEKSENYAGLSGIDIKANKATLDQIIARPEQVIDEVARTPGGIGADEAGALAANLATLMTDAERYAYFMVRDTQGPDAAADYFDQLTQRELWARDQERIAREAAEYAEAYPIQANIASVAAAPFSAIAGAAAFLTGEDNPNAPARQLSVYKNQIRETTGQNIAEAVPMEGITNAIGFNPLQVAYSGVMSGIDSVVSLIAMGGNPAAAAGFQAVGAGGESRWEALDRGTDADAASLAAIGSGVIEYLTEKLPLDKLMKTKPADTIGGFVKNIILQGATEAGEEGASYIANEAYSYITGGDDGELVQRYNDLTQNGYSHEGALWLMAKEAMSEFGSNVFGGFVAGAGMGTGATAIETAQQGAIDRQTGQQIIDQGNAEAIIRAAEQYDGKKKSIRALGKRLREKMQASADGTLPDDAETRAETQVLKEEMEAEGVQPEAAETTKSTETKEETKANNEAISQFVGSPKKLGKLYRRLVTALEVDTKNATKQEMREAIKARLEQLGEKPSPAVADAIAAAVVGDELSRKQADILEAAAYAKPVLNELLGSLARNSSDWTSRITSDATAKKIDTMNSLRRATREKIRVDEESETAETPEIKVSDSGTATVTDAAGAQTEAEVVGVADAVDGVLQAVVKVDGKEQTVPITQVQAASEEQATLIARASEIGDTEAANEMLRMFKGGDAAGFADAFTSAYEYGTTGGSYTLEQAQVSARTTGLSREQIKTAYDLGAARAAAEAAQSVPFRSSTKGRLTLTGRAASRAAVLDANQKAAVHALRRIAEVTGINIEVFESAANGKGEYASENGSFDRSTNTMRIDINAGRNSKASTASYAMLRVAGHELTHYIRANNRAGYQKLQDYVVPILTEKDGRNFDELVAAKQDAYERQFKKDLSYDDAVEEVVADACEMMLKDSTAVQQLAQKDKSLFKRIRSWITNFVNSVKRAFQGVNAQSDEAKAMLARMDELQKMWDDALVQAVENTQAKNMPDGSAFEYKENAEPTPARGVASNGSYALPINSASENSIAEMGEDVKFQLRDPYTLTDREMLVGALETAATSDAERNALGRYRSNIAELYELEEQLAPKKEEISSIYRSRGKRDMAHLNKLKAEAAELEEKISKIDKQLLNLESTASLKSLLEREKTRLNRKASAERKAALGRVRERREATELRHKIRAVLDDFNRRLKSPTEKKYIPANFVGAVIAAGELINTDSGRGGEKAAAKIAQIRGVYEQYKSDPMFNFAYDEVVAGMLDNLQQIAGNKSIYQLGMDELQAVYDVVKALKKQVTEAIQLKSGEYGRNIVEVGREMALDTIAAEPIFKNEKISDLLNWHLSPGRFFSRLGGYKKGSAWTTVVADSFNRGTETMYEIQRDFYNHFRAYSENKLFDTLTSRKKLVDIGLKDNQGKKIEVTRGMMLSIYMHLLNEDNRRGIMYGGLTIPDLAKYYNGKMGDAYGRGSTMTIGTASELYSIAKRLREDNLNDAQREALEAQFDAAIASGEARLDRMKAAIEKQLTGFEKNLIKAAQAWNDGKSQSYINDVTMDLYGIKKANVKNYWRIHRDTSFIQTDFDSISKNVNLENWGSLKARVPSQAPVLLTDFAFEMDSNMQQMSRYVGFARAQRDFKKLYNVRLPGMDGSVKKAVSSKFGTGKKAAGVTGEQYIENFIGDITGSRTSETAFWGAVRRNIPRASLSLNLRVAASQLSAIPTAAAEVGWGNMAKGAARGLKNLGRERLEQISQENVWFWQRYRGDGGMREFADMKGGGNFIDKAYNWLDDKTNGWLLNWCQKADVASTAMMYSMAEEWVKKNTNHAPGTDAYKKAVNEKFSLILRNTQPNYTATEAADVLRDKRETVKMFTMFKTQNYQNFNMLYDAMANLRKTSRDFKNKANGVTKADLTQARQRAAAATTSIIIGANIAFSLLRLLVNAIMNDMNSYRDENDELTKESVATAMLTEFGSSITGMTFAGEELYELFLAAFTDKHYYGLNDSAISEISDLVSTAVNGDWSKEDTYKKLGFGVARVVGIPAQNMTKYYNAVSAWTKDIKNDEIGKFEGSVSRSNSTNYSRMLEASIAGDEAKWNTVKAELLEDPDLDNAEILSGYRSKIGEAYKDGELTYEQATDLLIKYGEKSEGDAYWQMDKWDYSKETGSSEDYEKYRDLNAALVSGNSANIRKEIKIVDENNETKSTIESIVKSEIRTLYLDGKINAAQAKTLLKNHCSTKDTDYSDANVVYWQMKDWDFAKANGGSSDGYSKYGTFLSSIEKGGSGMQKAAQELLTHGTKKGNIASAIAGKYKEQYVTLYRTNPTKAAQLLEKILDAYVAIGYDRSYERNYIAKNWFKEDDE